MRNFFYFALGCAIAATMVFSCDPAHALGNCPNNYAPLPTHPEVCVPAAKNLGRLDRLVNSCVAYGMMKVETEFAARQLPKTCASLILGGADWRRELSR